MTVYSLLSPAIPRRWNGPVWSSYFSMTPLMSSFALSRYEGRLLGSGEKATIAFAHRSVAFREHLLQRLLEPSPVMETLPAVSSLRVRETLRELARTTDLVFAQTGRYLAPRLFGADFMLLPAWVGHRTGVPSDGEARRRLLKRIDGDLDLIRRFRLTATLDPAPSSLPVLYRDYYLPSALGRHGLDAIVQQERQLRGFLRGGAILWIDSPEGRVAGMLIEREGGNLILRAMGVKQGEVKWSRQGGLAACYYYSFLEAERLGCATVDFRGTRPSLEDGIVRYKRKWSASLYDSPDLSFEDMAVTWERPSAALAAFFSRYAPIFRASGALYGACGRTTKTPEGLAAKIEIAPPGPEGNTARFLQTLGNG